MCILPEKNGNNPPQNFKFIQTFTFSTAQLKPCKLKGNLPNTHEKQSEKKKVVITIVHCYSCHRRIRVKLFCSAPHASSQSFQTIVVVQNNDAPAAIRVRNRSYTKQAHFKVIVNPESSFNRFILPFFPNLIQ